MHSIPDEALMGLERTLWELELTHGYLTSVPSRALRHLQKLRILNLKGKFTFKHSFIFLIMYLWSINLINNRFAQQYCHFND